MSNLVGYLTYFQHTTTEKGKASLSVTHCDDTTQTGGFIMIIFFSSSRLFIPPLTRHFSSPQQKNSASNMFTTL
jgi:hypothetical protein